MHSNSIKILIAGIILGTLIPSVSAAPPTKNWSITFNHSTNGIILAGQRADVHSNGNLVFGYHCQDSPDTTRDICIKVLTPSGSTSLSITIGCGATACTIYTIRWDLQSRIVMVWDNSDDRLLSIFNPLDGGIIEERNLDTELTPGLTGGNPRGLDVRTSGDTATDSPNYYLADNTIDRFIRVNGTTDATLQIFNVAKTDLCDVYYAPIPNVVYGQTCPSGTLSLNAETGATINTPTCGCTGNTGIDQLAARFTQTGETNVGYAGRARGTAGTTTIGWARYDFAAGTATNAEFTASAIGGFDTDSAEFDVDGNNDLLVCGVNNAVNGFITRGIRATNTLDWSIVNTDSGTDETVYCRFDYQGGFYTITNLPSADLRVDHYTGGEFVNPTNPKTYSAFTAPTTPTPLAGTDAGTGILNFGTDIFGDTAGSKFLYGLILFITILVVAARIMRRTEAGESATRNALLLIGGAAAIFLVIISVWPTWVSVVLIIAAAAIAMFLNRVLIGKFKGESAEE